MPMGPQQLALCLPAELPLTAPDVAIDGWNRDQEQLSFLYVPESPPVHSVLLKCLAMGESLLVTAASTQQGAPPETLDLIVGHYVTDAEDVSQMYQSMQGLVTRVNGLVSSVRPTQGPSSGECASGKPSTCLATTCTSSISTAVFSTITWFGSESSMAVRWFCESIVG